MTIDDMLLARAQAFCVAAHCAVGQKRKYTGEDYYHHPLEVAGILAKHAERLTNEMLAAAMLHDVVEDTAVTLEQVRHDFGDRVAELVEWVTDVSRPEDGNRATRKAKDREHLAQAPAEAQSIKLADMISNTSSILQHDPEFAKTYMREKQELLTVLTKGDRALYAMAEGIVGAYFGKHE